MQVRPDIKRISGQQVEFLDTLSEDFDAIVLATGYKSNVPFWLKVHYIFYHDISINIVECNIRVAQFSPLDEKK
jgi:lysine/ornithine N-monooxygenase